MESHRCASNRLCRNKTQEDGKWKPAAITWPEGFCDKCSRQIGHAYRAALADYTSLQAVIGDTTVQDTVKVAGTPTPPMPLNATVIALSATLSELCEQSVTAVADELRIEPRRRQKAKGWPVKEELPIIQARNIIPDHLDKLAATEVGRVAALGVWQTHRQIEQFLGEGRQRTRLAMPCPVIGCGRKTLGIDNGSTDVTCTACGGRWSEREYNWLSTLLVTEINSKEHGMLEWLLAEKDWRLSRVERLARLKDEDFDGIDGITVIKMLREILV